MIGFSVVPEHKGYGCFYTENSGAKIFPISEAKLWLDRYATHDEVATLDSKLFYKAFPHLSNSYLQQLKLFDIRAFRYNLKNELDINVAKIAQEAFGITLKDEMDRIRRIWNIQKEERWEYVPHLIKMVYLEKAAKAACVMGNAWSQYRTANLNSYMEFFQEFLLYLTRLEAIGVYDENHRFLVPEYLYDTTITGRLLNRKPFCFQTLGSKLRGKFKSRFDKGEIWLADWRNIDFRVSLGLSRQMASLEKADPYTYFQKKLGVQTRKEAKDLIMKIMYGEEDDIDLFKEYPNLKVYRDKVIADATKLHKVTTPMGKTRFFTSKDNMETKAFSGLIQMTVADLCKRAIIEIQREFEGLESTPIPIVIYDSFMFDIKPSEREQAYKAIKKSLIERTIPQVFRSYVTFDCAVNDIYGRAIK